MRKVQKQAILNDLKKKMVFLVGPRQVGKTYLSKEIMKEYKHPLYLNYDNVKDKVRIKNMDWSGEIDLLVLDEIHKMPKWKNFVKGVFDVRPASMHILVTGSARLDTFRKAGDSMAGRFYLHHLLPFSFKELLGTSYEGGLDRLIERSGFPEPFLADDIGDAVRWRQNYQDRLVKQDILDFSKIEKISEFQNILEILKTKVGSEISYENIAGDLSISPKTVKKYVEILEALYIIFLLRPFSHKIARTIRKSPKVYFYDTALVDGDEGTVFENLVGLSLLKQSYGLKDIKGQIASVMYLRDKEKREVDFVLVNEKKEIISLIEVKLSEDAVSKPLNYFTEKLGVKGVQVVKNIRYSFKGTDKIEVREAKSYLSEMFL